MMIILKWICVLTWVIIIGLLTTGTLLNQNQDKVSK
jgi:hypothetical protein